MTKNERRLLKVLIGVTVVAISAINVLATRDAKILFSEYQNKYALAMRSVSVLNAEINAMGKEIQEREKRSQQKTVSGDSSGKTDILSVGYQSRKVIDEYGIEVVRYAMDKTASSELVTYTIKSSPESFISFLNKMNKAPEGLGIPSCEVKAKEQTSEVEGQFSVGYEK
jgi:hypothetical protein